MTRHLYWLLRCMGLMAGLLAGIQAGATTCTPHIVSVQAAQASAVHAGRPAQGWVLVDLPDRWTQRWPQHSGSVWYRVDWDRGCPVQGSSGAQPLGLLLSGINMAGAVYLNDDLLWRDASLTAPLSHSWNTPRWWTLPASALQPRRNTLWIHVVGAVEMTPGLSAPVLGDAMAVEALYGRLLWRQRTAYELATVLSTSVAAIFFVVWCFRPQEQAFGWFALMSGVWVVYQASILATAPWPIWPFAVTPDNPFRDSLAMARLNLIAMVLYVLCFCIFTLRYGRQHAPRWERCLWVGAGLALAAMVCVPRSWLESTSQLVVFGCGLVFSANCLQFQWHAWRSREMQNGLLALCWGVFLVVGLHDLWVVMKSWHAHETWTPLTSIVITVFMALLLGSRLATGMRKIERFNLELETRIAQARQELKQALNREHSQMLEHTRLQERVQLAHDLHDSLGGSLVRSMAVVERARRAQQPLESEKVLSLLKLLRNDLRQIIDYGSVAAATPPPSPERWLAPLRHRFVRIFDELDIAWEWPLDSHWHSACDQPSALQCLNIERIVEEALSNALKHAHATCIRVRCVQSVAERHLTVYVEDDGAGFDPAVASDHSNSHVGLRSMKARALHSGTTLEVHSAVGQGTRIGVRIAWSAGVRAGGALPTQSKVDPEPPPVAAVERSRAQTGRALTAR